LAAADENATILLWRRARASSSLGQITALEVLLCAQDREPRRATSIRVISCPVIAAVLHRHWRVCVAEGLAAWIGMASEIFTRPAARPVFLIALACLTRINLAPRKTQTYQDGISTFHTDVIFVSTNRRKQFI